MGGGYRESREQEHLEGRDRNTCHLALAKVYLALAADELAASIAIGELIQVSNDVDKKV
jgi:hypothetical protein